MKCHNHPETETETTCNICQSPICEECTVTLGGKNYCTTCLEAKVHGGDESDTAVHQVFNSDFKPVQNNKRSAFSVLVLSLIPGGGYMYLGLMNRGLQALVLFFLIIFVSTLTHLALLILALPVLMFYAIFDALQLAGRMRDDIPVEDLPLIDIHYGNGQNWLAYGLIALGVIALLNNYLPYVFDYQPVQQLIAPVLIIALGGYLLARERGK